MIRDTDSSDTASHRRFASACLTTTNAMRQVCRRQMTRLAIATEIIPRGMGNCKEEKQEEMSMVQRNDQVDYGQDAPFLLRKYLLAGGLLAGSGGLLAGWSHRRTTQTQRILFPLATALLLTGIVTLTRGAVMIYSSRISKVRAADHLLDDLGLRGDETVLDVGCGRGLLLIRAAKRLPSGRAIGIDLWSQEDQGANSMQATLDNARAEDVTDRVEIHEGDMRDLSFLLDASVDAVVASKSIHNIADRAGRRLALGEIVRVLKPGGHVALMDIFLVGEFAEVLQSCGMQEVRISASPSCAYPPLSIVTGRKRN